MPQKSIKIKDCHNHVFYPEPDIKHIKQSRSLEPSARLQIVDVFPGPEPAGSETWLGSPSRTPSLTPLVHTVHHRSSQRGLTGRGINKASDKWIWIQKCNPKCQ
ncbi:unnamed protein product [Arctogadus glacialis]